jgi:hypothetical protein
MTTELLPIEDGPTRTGSTAAVAASTVVVLTTVLAGALPGAAITVCGLVGVVVGLRRGHDRMVDAGTVALVAGVVVAAAVGAAPVFAAVGAAAAIVARAAATDALVRGRQIGRAAAGRVEGYRAARTAGLVGVAALCSAALTTQIAPGLPTVAVLALVVGSVLMVLALR